jgi:hypothetical protein
LLLLSINKNTYFCSFASLHWKVIMKISGFTFARNADILYYPIRESISSILPLCDEFIVLIGKGDPSDRTREIVQSIRSPKIRIMDTVWREKEELGDHVFREQANLGLHECSGDWCFHLQPDEVVHEDHIPRIRQRCLELLNNKEVEGMLFSFRHFWGDYEHYQRNHKWFTHEIRIVRNGLGIESYRDSQSFRLAGKKLHVASCGADIYHYGWVRPPKVMQTKRVLFTAAASGKDAAVTFHETDPELFDFGPLNRIPIFQGTHPAVMKEWIGKMNWKDNLDYQGTSKKRYNHDRLKYKILTFLEQRLFNGKQIGGFKNYILDK